MQNLNFTTGSIVFIIHISEKNLDGGKGDTQNIGSHSEISGVVVQNASGNAKIGGKGARFIDKQNIGEYKYELLDLRIL